MIANLVNRPEGTPKDTGRTLVASVATVRIDETPAPNPRVAIHVEHPSHDGGVRCFYRRRDGDVAGSIRSHIRTELDPNPVRIEVIDNAGAGLSEAEVLPRRLQHDPTPPEIEVGVA